MAKKKNNGRTGTGKQSRQEQASAREQEKREANAAKSRRMGNAFLFAFLSLIGVFCLYTVIRVFFFPAGSVSELRSNCLFVSLFAIPYLIMAGAVVIRALRRGARESASSGVRRAENLLFLAVLIGSFALFSVQTLSGQTDASGHRAVTALEEALAQSGLPVTDPEVSAFRSALEPMSMEGRVVCGSVTVTLNYHEGSSMILNRFPAQVRVNYAGLKEAETEIGGAAVSLWPADADQSVAAAAVCARTGQAVMILELEGPEEQVKLLRPLLQQAAGRALGGSD